jgi:acyl carrier protein
MEFKNLGHLMIDLETLGTPSNSVICSIGAVEFDLKSGEIGRKFHETISIQSCLDAGLKIQGETIGWWFQQSDSARLALLKDNKTLSEVLYLFRRFIESLGIDSLMVWGNGSRFDLGQLHDAYRANNKQVVPWQFRNERDVRTYIMDHLFVREETTFIGVQHNALDDCLHQIRYMCKTYMLKNVHTSVVKLQKERKSKSEAQREELIYTSYTIPEIQEKIKEIIESKFYTLENIKYGDSTLLIEDIGFDSLDIVTLIMELEKTLNITINDEQIEGLKTVGDLTNIVVNNPGIGIITISK